MLLAHVFSLRGVAAAVGAYCVYFLVALYLRKKRYPEKSWLNNSLNLLLGPLRFFKLGPYRNGALSIENALKYASKKKKLTDFGSMDFADAYQAIVKTPTQQLQRYTNLGYISGRIELNMTMVRRLKFIEYLNKVPAVTKVPVVAPVFVMGLPRTGTTLLHRLLSLDTKRCRAPLLWELLAAVPGVGAGAGNGKDFDPSGPEMQADRDSRAKFIRRLIATRKSMGDRALEHIHEIGSDNPEECFFALSDSVPCLSQYLYSMYMHPETAMPVMKQHMGGAYKHYKKYLQLLSYQIGEGVGKQQQQQPRTWMLKCPAHLFYTTEIAQAFPDAKLIWTHRHPVSAVPSMCSLLKSIHQMYFENECRDDFALGRNMLKVSEDLLAQAPEDIKAAKLPCADVVYEKLIADPVGVVQKIYLQFGWEYTDEYDAVLRQHVDTDKRNREALKAKKVREGVAKSQEVLHTYSPEEFGMTSQELSTGKYADYIKKFSVPESRG